MKLFSKTFLIVSILSATNVYAQNMSDDKYQSVEEQLEVSRQAQIDLVNQIIKAKEERSRAINEEIDREQQKRMEYMQQEAIMRQQRQEIARQQEMELQKYIQQQQELSRLRNNEYQNSSDNLQQEDDKQNIFNIADLKCEKEYCVSKYGTPVSGIVEIYDGDILKAEINYKKGRKNGIQKTYYESGDLQAETNYIGGKKNGIHKEYYESGDLQAEGEFKNDKLNGIIKSYYESGTIHKELSYKNDKLNGIQKEYYESGALHTEISYKNGKVDGVQKEYFESGVLHTEVPYKNDKLDGVQKTYYESGALQTEVNYKDNNIENIQKEYYESGALHIEANFKNNQRNGVLKTYQESGALISEENYNNDEKEGIQKEYYANGNLKKETNYVAGKISGVQKEYFESGVLHTEANFSDNNLDGIQKEYNESGNLVSETNYEQGKVQGVVVEYSEDGKWKFVNIYNYLKYYTPYVWDFIKTHFKEISILILSLLLLIGIIRITPWVKRTCIKAKNDAFRKVENAKNCVITKANTTKEYVKNKRDNLIDKCKETKNITTGKISTFKLYVKEKCLGLGKKDEKSNVIQLNKKVILILGIFVIAVLLNYNFSGNNVDINSNTQSTNGTDNLSRNQADVTSTGAPTTFGELTSERDRVAACSAASTRIMMCVAGENSVEAQKTLYMQTTCYQKIYKVSDTEMTGTRRQALLKFGSNYIISISNNCNDMTQANAFYREFCLPYMKELNACGTEFVRRCDMNSYELPACTKAFIEGY